MSHPNRAAAADRHRPSRGAQMVIWVLFAAALTVGFSLSGYRDAARAPVQAAPTTATAAASSTPLVLAGSGVAPADNSYLREKYAADPEGLLPAMRWSHSLTMPTDLGWRDQLAGQGVGNQLAEMMFGVASWAWSILFSIVSFAVGMDVVSMAATQIDAGFRAAAMGLGKTGLPLVAVCVAVFIGAMRVLRGKVNQAFSVILGAAVVVGGLSFLTAAAAGPTRTFDADGAQIHAASVGSPAYIAQRGNIYVNAIVGQVVTGFGATNSVTAPIQNGTFATTGDTDGATCAYYIQRLYSSYQNYAGAQSGSTAGLQASSLSLVSFMWQRGLYDNWTTAAFGSLGDGSRIACHQLENNTEGVDALEQFSIVGGNPDDVTKGATAGPYAGMAVGPFYAITDSSKNDQAAVLAWAACGGADGQSARAGWKEAGSVGDDECHDWWTWGPTNTDYASWSSGSTDSDSVGINSGGSSVLKWEDYDSLKNSTQAQHDSADAARGEVRTVVSAYYGHNGGQRMFAGLMSMITVALYSWAFGMSAAGTILTQVGLLFFLTLLPYTLLMLAFPTKDGGRSKMGKKMLKMTVTFLAGKALFLALLAATIEMMGILFTLASSFSGSSGSSAAAGHMTLAASGSHAGMYTMWSMIIPAVTIFVMRAVTKALGLGDMMSLSGAAGFATSAVLAGDKKAQSQFQNGLNNSPLGRTLDRADSRVKKTLANPLHKAKDRLSTERNGGKLADALKNGDISDEQFKAIVKGKMTLAQALKENKALQEGLTPELARAVATGQMTLGQAKALAKARAKDEKDDTDGSETDAPPAGTDGPEPDALPAGTDGPPPDAPPAGTNGPEPDASPVIGGYAGVAERLGALGEDELAGPVFGPHVLEAGADLDELGRLQTDRRTALKLELGDLQDPDDWAATVAQDAMSTLEELRAGSQGVEFGVALTSGQINAEKVRIGEELGGVPPELILLGSSGAPPILAPLPRDPATNQMVLPEGLSTEAALALIMNPANFMELSKKPGESEEQFHLSTVLHVHDAGCMDYQGQIGNVLKAQGIDLGKQSDRAEVLLAVEGKSRRLNLDDIRITVEDNDRRAIDAVVRQYHPRSQVDPVMRGEQVHSVEMLASSAQQQAHTVKVELEETVTHVLDAQGTADFSRELDRVLRAFEDRIPAVVTDLGAVTLEARITDERMGGAVLDHGLMMSQVKELTQAGERQVEQLQRMLANQVAQIKVTVDPSAQAELVKTLHKELEGLLDAVGDDLVRQVSIMQERATEELRTNQQHLAAQVQSWVRSSDFSGGAKDIAD